MQQQITMVDADLMKSLITRLDLVLQQLPGEAPGSLGDLVTHDEAAAIPRRFPPKHFIVSHGRKRDLLLFKKASVITTTRNLWRCGCVVLKRQPDGKKRH